MEELRIIEPSQELIFEALKTIPVNIERLNLEFLANGILPFANEEQMAEHSSECEKAGVIPSSKIKLHYDSSQETVIIGQIEIINYYGPHLFKEVAEKIIVGGKFHKVEYIFVDYQRGKAYKEFKDKHLDSLVENGYKLKFGDIWFSQFEGVGYHKGSCDRTSGVVMNHQRIEAVGPNKPKEFYDNVPEEKKQPIIDWFASLAKK